MKIIIIISFLIFRHFRDFNFFKKMNFNEDIELGACELLRSDHSRGRAGGLGWLEVCFGLFVGRFF